MERKSFLVVLIIILFISNLHPQKKITSYPKNKEAFFLGVSFLENETFEKSIKKFAIEYLQDYEPLVYKRAEKENILGGEVDRVVTLLKEKRNYYENNDSIPYNYLNNYNISKDNNMILDLGYDILHRVRKFNNSNDFKYDTDKRTYSNIKLKFSNIEDFNSEYSFPEIIDDTIFLNIFYSIENLDLQRGKKKSINFKLECFVDSINILSRNGKYILASINIDDDGNIIFKKNILGINTYNKIYLREEKERLDLIKKIDSIKKVNENILLKKKLEKERMKKLLKESLKKK